MARKLKVYAWNEYRSFGQPSPNGDRSCTMIVAAKSKAEAARIAGYKSPFNLCETRNAASIARATVDPGKIFWRKASDWDGKFLPVPGGKA